ncbi:MAG: GNAT family N-acetyltransferase [Blastocatellia bacterium]
MVQLALRAWAPVFESIEKVLHPDLYRASYPDGWESSQRQAVKEACSSGEMHVFTANEANLTLGFVAIRLDEKSKMGEIYMIAVDPDAQKRGVASSLTDFALERMKESGMEAAMVETGADPGHEPARRTYEKAGFRPWPAVKFVKYL